MSAGVRIGPDEAEQLAEAVEAQPRAPFAAAAAAPPAVDDAPGGTVPSIGIARFGGLLGASAPMRALFARLARAAERDMPLLLQGESGTGKDLAAAAVHQASRRRAGPFVVVDCGSIPPALVESELFGYEGGARLGGGPAYEGAFIRADGGTILLDEIGDLDIRLQPRLLRVIERGEVRPIGRATAEPVDVRVIAATHRDLRREVKRGAFREDLYHRLAVATVALPPLREHAEDVPLLARHFLDQHAREDCVDYTLPDEMMDRLVARAWTGNVRELRNVIHRIVAFGTSEITAGDAGAASFAGAPAPAETTGPGVSFKIAKARIIERFERDYVVAILAAHQGNISAAAKAADVDRVHFLRLMDRHNLRKKREG
jgi:DNA-binding NtrC family response regulator